jgi:hypothetical protein
MGEEEPTPRFPKLEDTEAHDRSNNVEDMVSPRDITMERIDPSKSPLLTARRVSTFDEVQLEEQALKEEGDIERRGRSATEGANDRERSQSRSSATIGANSAAPTPNPGSTTWGQGTKQVPASVTRKLSSPFAWLSRKKTTPQESTSPPAPIPRRHTATSGTINGKPDFILSRLDEDKINEARLSGKDSLKERFKLLRMREEAGVDIDRLSPGSRSSLTGTATLNGSNSQRSSDFGLGIDTSKANLDGQSSVSTSEEGKSKTRSSSIASAIDPNLPPGTVAGMNVGPTQDAEAGVDWDLWQSLVYEGPSAVAKTSPAELTKAITNGIPSAIRGVVWQILAHSKNEELELVYRELVNRGTDKEFAPSPNPSGTSQSAPASANSLASTSTYKESVHSSASSTHSGSSTPATTNGMTSPVYSTAPADIDANTAKSEAAMNAERQKKAKEELTNIKKLEKTIRKDLGSRSNYSKYAVAAGLQEGLFGVCKAYALFDEGVGYAQGMNFIVMPLLFNMPEEEAFCLLVRLMNQYKLRELFIQDMPGLHKHLYQFERLLEDLEPALCYHLHKRGVVPSLYATPWFLTLFAYRFPLQLVLRVYDLILSEGLEGAILKFALAVMQKNAATLMGIQDMSALKTFLNEKLFDVYIDSTPSANSILESGFFGSSGGSDKVIYRADELIQDACSVNITPEAIKQYSVDYETRTRLEKEREAEFENLRQANAGLASKVKEMKQQAERADSDHAQMATELIRNKMENEDLKAANEELKGQVEELRKIVATQPEEVEARLKDEMERIMTRNSEVQNENRALEEQMAEMEKDLVETKMRYAEVSPLRKFSFLNILIFVPD